MMPIKSLSALKYSNETVDRSPFLKTDTFINAIHRWKEKALCDGVEFATEAERRLLLGTQHIDLSNLGLKNLPDDIALPPNVMMLDLSGNPLLEHLPEFFFSQSETLNVNIEGTLISNETTHCIQEQVRGIHFTHRMPVKREVPGPRNEADDFDDVFMDSDEDLSSQNEKLSGGKSLWQQVNEMKMARNAWMYIAPPPFAIKHNISSLFTGMLFVLGNIERWSSYFKNTSINSENVGSSFIIDHAEELGDGTIFAPEQFSNRYRAQKKENTILGDFYDRFRNKPAVPDEIVIDIAPANTVLDMVKLIKPGFSQKIGKILGSMSQSIPLPLAESADYSNYTRVDSMPIFDEGIIEDSEIALYMKSVTDLNVHESGFIKERITQIWSKETAPSSFKKLFAIIKTINNELGDEREWKTIRNEFENIIYNLKNDEDRKEYAKYEFEYMSKLVNIALENSKDLSMDLSAYIDKWIVERIKEFETLTGNQTSFTPSTRFNLKNTLTKEPQILHRSLRPHSDGNALTYKMFSLREIALGFPFNTEAENYPTQWVGGGAHFTNFMEEQRRNAPFLEFLFTKDLQGDISEAFKSHMKKPRIQRDIKTLSEKMIVLRCVSFLNLPEKERSPEYVAAIKDFLEGEVMAKRVSYKGTTLNSVFMIPTKNELGIVLATDDSHFYFVENKMFRSHFPATIGVYMFKIIKNEAGLDSWILSKMPEYQRLRQNNTYEAVMTMKIRPSHGSVFFSDHFISNILFEGDYTIDTLSQSFFESYTKTYLEDIDTIMTSPAEHQSEQNKKLAIDVIGDMSTVLTLAVPLSGILSNKLMRSLMKAMPLTLSTAEVSLVGSLISASDHPSARDSYTNEIILSLIGLSLDLPEGIGVSKEAAKKSLNTLMHQFQQKIKRKNLLDTFFTSLSTKISQNTGNVTRSSQRKKQNNVRLATQHDIERKFGVPRKLGHGLDNPGYRVDEEEEIITVWGSDESGSTSTKSVITAYSEENIYYDLVKLRQEQVPSGTVSSIYSRRDLENSPTSKEVSTWWRQRNLRDLTPFGTTTAGELAKKMFNNFEVPEEYELFFYNMKQIELAHLDPANDKEAKLKIFDELERCVLQLFDAQTTGGFVDLPKEEHKIILLYLSELHYWKKAIKTEFEFKEAITLSRTQDQPYDIRISNAKFFHLNAHDTRYHKELYEKIFRGGFSEALKSIESLSKSICINSIIKICKEYDLNIDFIRITLQNKNGRLALHDIPRLFIGEKDFSVYPLGLKNGLIGIDDLGEFGQGAVLISGNVSIMEMDIMKRIIQKKYFSYDIALGPFSDESKLLSLENNLYKGVETHVFYQSLLQGDSVQTSSPIGIDFSDLKSDIAVSNRQGVFEMKDLAESASSQLLSDNFKKMIKTKFHSQVNDQLQPMSIGVPTIGLSTANDFYFLDKQGAILNERQVNAWDMASFVFKDELNALGIDIVVCVDDSMQSNYYNRRHRLTERFRRILWGGTAATTKKIRYLYSDLFALPSRITADNVRKNALDKLNAAVNTVEQLMKKMGKKIAIQSNLRNDSAALVKAGLIIKKNLSVSNRDQALIFKQINTPSGNVHAPIIVESAIEIVRQSDPMALSQPRHIELLTRYAYKLIF